VTGHPLAAREPRPFPSAQETPAVLRDTSAGEPSKVLPRVPACSLLPRAIGFAVVIVQGNWGGRLSDRTQQTVFCPAFFVHFGALVCTVRGPNALDGCAHGSASGFRQGIEKGSAS